MCLVMCVKAPHYPQAYNNSDTVSMRFLRTIGISCFLKVPMLLCIQKLYNGSVQCQNCVQLLARYAKVLCGVK